MLKRIAVDYGRNVFEVFLMLLAIMSGLTGLFEPTPVTPVPGEPLLPIWGRLIWYGGLVLGGLITLSGLSIGLPHGLRVEQAGLLLLVGSGLSYVVLALGSNAVAQAAVVLVFSLTLLVRMYYLRWEPKAIVAAVRLIQSDVDDAL
jgi:hypothetical protein